MIKITEQKPDKMKDIIGIDKNGRKHYCFLSKCGEWRCSLTGFALLIEIVEWEYDTPPNEE